jgi:hypothetical protein
MGKMEHLEHLDKMAHLVKMEHLVKMGKMEHLVKMEHPEHKEIQVLTHYGTGRASTTLNHNIKKVTLLPIRVQHIVETVRAIV